MAGLPGPRGAPGPVGPPGDTEGWAAGLGAGRGGAKAAWWRGDGPWVPAGEGSGPYWKGSSGKGGKM